MSDPGNELPDYFHKSLRDNERTIPPICKCARCKQFSREKWENLKNMQPKEFAEKMKNDSEASNSEYLVTSNIRDFEGELKGFGFDVVTPGMFCIYGG